MVTVELLAEVVFCDRKSCRRIFAHPGETLPLPPWCPACEAKYVRPTCQSVKARQRDNELAVTDGRDRKPATGPRCQHCKTNKAVRPRRLCARCYRTDGVKDLYPAFGKAVPGVTDAEIESMTTGGDK